MSSCSVIIVAKKSSELLFATVETVLVQKQLAELIIVDSGGTPDVIARLQQYGLSDPRIKIISARGDFHFARNYNNAAREAASEYLLLLKAGYILSPDALPDMIKALESDGKAMLVSGLVLNHKAEVQNVFRSNVVTPKSTLFDIVALRIGHIKNAFAEDSIAKNVAFETATVHSACMCIRASDYKRLAGLDEIFFPQDEELDLSLRVKLVGGLVLCVPSVKITRMPDDNGGRISVAQQLYDARNTMRYLKKFFAAHLVFGALFLLNSLILFHLFIKILGGGFVEFFQEEKPRYNSDSAKRLMILALGAVDLQKSEELSKKIVLVTGAESQVGLSVIRRLIAAGAGVIAITKNEDIPYYHNNLRWMKKDLSDPSMGLDGYLVDFVVHTAPIWYLPPILPMLHNAEAGRIIAFSSTMVFSTSLSANDYEKDFVARLQGAEAALAEKCTELNINYTIFRPTQIYGVGLDAGISAIARVISRFGFMMVYPTAFGRRQPVHAHDLADAVMQSIKNEITYGKTYNLSGSEALTYRDMLAKLFALYHKKPKIIESTALPFMLDVAGKLLRRKNINGEIARRMNDDLVFFHDEAKSDFGYHPRAFLTGGIKDIEGF